MREIEDEIVNSILVTNQIRLRQFRELSVSRRPCITNQCKTGIRILLFQG